jgi:hypothetical protein
MLKYLLLLVVLFAFSPATRVAAYNFAPPIEPIAKPKITAKSVKSTLTHYQTKWKIAQAKPNKTKADGYDILLTVIISLLILSLIGLPLGYGLGVAWLWISSLSILGAGVLLVLFGLVAIGIDYNPKNKMVNLGVAIITILVLIYLFFLLIDMAIVAIIAWLPWFWIVFGALALVIGLVILFLFTLD